MSATTEVLIRLFEGTKRSGTCRGCLAAVDWYETVAGKRMPMNGGAMPRRSETNVGTPGIVGFFAASDSHWSTYPAREQFKRRR